MLRPLEVTVVAMIDDGVPARRVARDTGLNLAYVQWIATRYGHDALERQDERRDAATRASTMALERAILATGRRHT